MSETETKKTLSTEEKILVGRVTAAELFDVSVRTIDNLIHDKVLRPRRIRGRCLFLRSELEALARGNRLR